MKFSNIDVFLYAVCHHAEERKRCGGHGPGISRKQTRLGEYFSDPSWNHSARPRSRISGINGMFTESAGLADVAQNPES